MIREIKRADLGDIVLFSKEENTFVVYKPDWNLPLDDPNFIVIGIVLAQTSKEKPQIAEVVAVGPGGMVDGKEVKMQLVVGDKVVYSKYAGTTLKYNDDEYIIVKQDDILAIIED